MFNTPANPLCIHIYRRKNEPPSPRIYSKKRLEIDARNRCVPRINSSDLKRYRLEVRLTDELGRRDVSIRNIRLIKKFLLFIFFFSFLLYTTLAMIERRINLFINTYTHPHTHTRDPAGPLRGNANADPTPSGLFGSTGFNSGLIGQ